MAKLLCFGSMNIDEVYSVDHIVLPGETLASTGVQVFPGGKGTNQSVALARAGGNAFLAGLIGGDGLFLTELAESAGVDAGLVEVSPLPTGKAIIQVSALGQNSIVFNQGANGAITEEFIRRVLAPFDSGDYIVLQSEITLPHRIIELAAGKGMTVAFNPSPMNHAASLCDMAKVDYLFINEVEGHDLTGKTEPDEILDAVLASYPNTRVILTLGGNGAVYRDSAEEVRQGIFQANAVDTTAAGDTFTGYFLAAVAAGKTPTEAMRLASKASAVTVSRKGAAPSIPSLEEVKNTELEELPFGG